MRPLSTPLHPRLCLVLLALGLILLMLQQVSASAELSPQQPAGYLSQQLPQHHDSNQCAADCISTLQHCCLYALSAGQPLSLCSANPVPSSTLVYLLNSRSITPQTPPPKPA